MRAHYTRDWERWEGAPAEGCPFPQSNDIRGIGFTNRFASYTKADYWYPACATDGNLYAGHGDGRIDGDRNVHAGIAKISGDNPMDLDFTYLGNVDRRSPGLFFNCTNLILDGVWYYGMEEGWNTWSATGIGRFWGFLHSADFDHTVGDLGYPLLDTTYWKDATVINPHREWSEKHDTDPRWQDRVVKNKWGQDLRLYPKGVPVSRPRGFFPDLLHNSRLRGPHCVDFGPGNAESPDGMVYMTAHGSEGQKLSEWANGDNIYLLRTEPRLECITDPDRWEYFCSKDTGGKAIWSRRISEMKPLLSWPDKLGLSNATYIAPLRKYIMCISPLLGPDTDIEGREFPKRFSADGALLLEADMLTGPWRLVEYLQHFATNSYCMCIPSKFVSKDGGFLWLLYSAGWMVPGVDPGVDAHPEKDRPPRPLGSSYAANFCEVRLDLA